MNEKRKAETPEISDVVSGQAARRNFIKNSGRMAIAAPAVVLLLSAGSKSALAASPYNQRPLPPTPIGGGGKNLLDPP